MNEILSIDNVTKHYGSVRAVDGISLGVKKGEIYGFLGLNGAGKTTTIRLLLGLIRPTSGSSYICGKKVKPGNQGIWKKVGYLVEIPYSYPTLTVRENLEMTRRLRFLPNKKPVNEVIDKLHLGAYAERKAKYLSQGNAQRLGIAKALIHNPEILILDEPSNGLDPAGIYEIRELLKNLACNHGVTIFISSHLLGEISKFATRIGIIHEGRMIREVGSGQLEELCMKRLLIETKNRDDARLMLLRNGYSVNAKEEGILEISDKKVINHPEDIAILLVNAGFPPAMLRVDEENLESYFLRTIGMKGNIK
jgi:ABC-2 type transport system ATP-binding protein